ncbi:MAG: potassium-transporting ATPase subunit KdpA [Pseudomonadota bacterium]
MSEFLHIIISLAIVAILIKPLGKYIALVFMGRQTYMEKPLGWLERLIYRICAIDENKEMNWMQYAGSVILLGFLGFSLLFFILVFQDILPLNPQNFASVRPDLAFNIAISFVTNGNWQSYSGENILSNFSQTIGLSVQNFISTATGLTAFAAISRGIFRRQMKTIGNFYVDVVRGIVYIFLPLSFIFAIFLASQGVVQNFNSYTSYEPLETQTLNPESRIPGGAVASQVAMRTIGSSGGGFFGANGAHPFENPTPLSNFIQSIAILLIPTALTYAFGCMIGDRRQGWALIATMSIIFIPLLILSVVSEKKGNPLFDTSVIDTQEGNMEGKEIRFGTTSSALHASIATATSNGSSNSALDSFFPLGALSPVILTQFSEVIFGGIGSGIYNIMAFVILTVFVGSLMVGRVPEYMGKKINAFEIKMASLIVIFPAVIVLFGTAIAISTDAGKAAILNSGAQGFSEILYAFSSAGNNDGASFAGIKANTEFYNISLGIAMFFSRYFVIIAAFAIAGSFAGKNITPTNAGTLPTHTPLFVFLLTWILIIVGILTYVPAIVLGPVAEHFHIESLVNDKISINNITVAK